MAFEGARRQVWEHSMNVLVAPLDSAQLLGYP